MAGFGTGFARSFLQARGQNIARDQFEQGQTNSAEQVRIKAFTKQLQDTEKSSVAAADEFVNIAKEAFGRGASMEQVAPMIVNGAQGALADYANLLNEMHAQRVAEGFADPNEPSPGDMWMEQQMSRIAAVLSLGQIQPEENVEGSAIFGTLTRDIEGVGVAGDTPRIQQIRTPEGIQLSANGVELQESDITQPIQKRAEVDLTTRTTSTLEESINNAREGLARLNEMERTLQRDFLTLPGKLRGFRNEVIDKINPDLLNDEEQQFLNDYKTFQKTAFDNINRYIKEITGAQMSEFEADRLRRGIPDPERDGPTAFEAKLRQSVRELVLAQARASRALNEGLAVESGDDLASFMTLSSVEQMIEDRHAELVEEGFDDAEALQIVKREFGL